MHRYTMISQDCHAGAPRYVYRQYMDVQHRDDYDRWLERWMGGVSRIGQLFAGVPVEEVRLMIGMNTARVYNFNVEKMNAIGTKIGPKVADISGTSE